MSEHNHRPQDGEPQTLRETACRRIDWHTINADHFDICVASSVISNDMWHIDMRHQHDGGPDPMDDPAYRLGLDWLNKLAERFPA